jgi:hypothetical protein
LYPRIRSGKTNEVLKHLLIADHYWSQGTPFYSKIVYSGSGGEDEMISSTFLKDFEDTYYTNTNSNLMQFLNEHLRFKKNYPAIYKFVIKYFKEPHDTMKKIIEKPKPD